MLEYHKRVFNAVICDTVCLCFLWAVCMHTDKHSTVYVQCRNFVGLVRVG